MDIDIATNAYDACEDAVVLVILTEWDEFRWLDLGLVRTHMATPRVFDARAIIEPAAARRAGFVYGGIGVS
jgi:UDPglucose 6-dehydrogenase